LLKVARENKGDRLDAYGSDLYDFYNRNGFEAVSYTPFNKTYKKDDWPDDGEHEEAVVFYKYVGRHKKRPYKKFIADSTVEYDGDDGYERAMKARDDAIKEGKK